MRFLLPLLLIGIVVPTLPSTARAEKPVCVDTSRIRNWITVDDETLLLDVGRKKYRVNLQHSCFNLGSSPTLQFKGDPITGRICGSNLDSIRTDGEQCRISSITEIDQQTFNEAQNKKKIIIKAKKSAGKAEQPVAADEI